MWQQIKIFSKEIPKNVVTKTQKLWGNLRRKTQRLCLYKFSKLQKKKPKFADKTQKFQLYEWKTFHVSARTEHVWSISSVLHREALKQILRLTWKLLDLYPPTGEALICEPPLVAIFVSAGPQIKEEVKVSSQRMEAETNGSSGGFLMTRDQL